jgi:hypothetical protein
MQNDMFGKIWSDAVSKFVLISSFIMIVSCFLPGISMSGTSATWLDTRNYGFLFLLAGIDVGISLFVSGALSFYVLAGGIVAAAFLVGINLMDLLRAVDYGANLSVGFYLYIFGIALGGYALYLKNAQSKGKQAVKINLKQFVAKEALPPVETQAPKVVGNVVFCPACGAPNDPSSNFCVKCGAKLPH